MKKHPAVNVAEANWEGATITCFVVLGRVAYLGLYILMNIMYQFSDITITDSAS